MKTGKTERRERLTDILQEPPMSMLMLMSVLVALEAVAVAVADIEAIDISMVVTKKRKTRAVKATKPIQGEMRREESQVSPEASVAC